MAAIRASAPGKILLLGEYAVLEGAPALTLAVDRRVRVEIGPSEGPGSLSAPQLGLHDRLVRVKGKRLELEGAAAGALGLTARFVPELLESVGVPARQAERLVMRIDSGPLYEQAAGGVVKLGLGSSAAVSAALARALVAFFRIPGHWNRPGYCLRAWLPVYRRALGAPASGADLAAAVCGGLSLFRDAGNGPTVAAHEMPANLQWQAVWTGHSAQTTDFVAAWRRWRRTDPDSSRVVAGMRRVAERAGRALGKANGAEVLLESAARYAEWLTRAGASMGREIMSAPHRRLGDLADECGVVYKSCGAGGGDLGIALAGEPASIDAFAGQVSRVGGVPVHLDLSATGARLESGNAPDTGQQ